MEHPLPDWPTMTVLAVVVWAVTLLISVLTIGIGWLRPSYPGWRAWSAGHAALVLGLLLGVLRTPETLLMSILLGNGLVMVGTALFVDAFQRFSGQIRSRKAVLLHAGGVAALLLALLFLTLVYDHLTARFLLVSAYLVVMGAVLVKLLIRQMIQERPLRAAYGFNLAVLVTVHVLSTPRLLTVGSGAHPEATFALNTPNVLMYVAVLLLSVGGTFAFWMLHGDRRRQEVQALHRELTELAYTDPLTSALNRRGLWRAFDDFRRHRAHAPSTLVLLDIDGFKPLNDQQGHAVGDHGLKQLSALLREVSRPDDVVSRIGGDEFVLLLTRPPAQVDVQLKLLTARLREGDGAALGFTVSFGHTQVEIWESLDSAMNRADEVMYQNKEASKALCLADSRGHHGVRSSLSAESTSSSVQATRARKPAARSAARQVS